MKERGFTLIELLAVILILGIIALIAIPAVTKMVEESRIKAFKETNQNIASVVEGECSTAQLKGTGTTAGYTFNEEGASGDIGVKGKLPTGGSVSTDNSCNSTVYTNNDKYCAIKTANDNEITVGKYTDGKCNITMKDDSYCTSDSNPGILSGTGTEIDPYSIESIEDLVSLVGLVDNDAAKFANKYVKLNSNLDFKNTCSYVDTNSKEYGDVNSDGEISGLMEELTTDSGFMPIGHKMEYMGKSYSEYRGNFDGGNHYISNLYINRSEESVIGLFGSLYSYDFPQEFKNINIINSDVVGKSYTSLLFGQVQVYNSIIMNNIHTIGNVTGTSDSGLVSGSVSLSYLASAEVSNITSAGSVNGTNGYIGGTFGEVSYGNYKNITNYALVHGNNYSGGVFGKFAFASLTGAKNYGKVNDLHDYNPSLTKYSIGGVIGYSSSAISVSDAYNYADVIGVSNLGGIIGNAQDYETTKYNNLYNYGDISYPIYGDFDNMNYISQLGGIIGNANNGTITNTYNYGDVTGWSRTGGLVGSISSSVLLTNLSNYGKVIGEQYIGGIAGETYNKTVSNLSNYGDVVGKKFVGGIIGSGSPSTFDNLVNRGDVKSSNFGQDDSSQLDIGGIIGQTSSSVLVNGNNAYNYGDVYGYYDTGGIIGFAGKVTGTNFANYGKVYGQYQTGGLIGETSTLNLTNILNQGDLEITSFESSSYNPLGGGMVGSGYSVILTNGYSIGNIDVESNNGYWARVGGALGEVTTAQLNNIHVESDISVNNNSSEQSGYIGGVIANSNSTSALTNIYYKGKITTNLSAPYAGTIVADSNATQTNVFYNNANQASFNVITGTAISNSTINSNWFKDTLSLGSAFDYSNGIYPRLYSFGTTTLIPNQKEIDL